MRYSGVLTPGNRTAILVRVAAIIVRALLAFAFGHVDYSRAEAQNIALSLVTQHSFAGAFAPGGGPTAHTAPVYPAINALFYAAASDSHLADQLRVCLNIVMAATVYSLLPLLAKRLGLGTGAGQLAGWIGALIPLHYWGELPGTFENTLSALLMTVFTLEMAPHLSGTVVEHRRAWRLGASGGFLVLTSPALLAPLLALFGVCFLRRTLAPSAITRSAFAGVLVLTPWTIRNLVIFHSPVFVRSNFGLELAGSNNRDATPDATLNTGTAYPLSHHPFQSAEARQKLRIEGEVEYSRQLGWEAVQWIRQHPTRFLRLALGRIFQFWFPVSRYLWHRIALGAVTLLALGGILMLWNRGQGAATVLASIAVSYSLVFVALQTSIRFTYPIWWILLLCASVFLIRVCERLAQPNGDLQDLRRKLHSEAR